MLGALEIWKELYSYGLVYLCSNWCFDANIDTIVELKLNILHLPGIHQHIGHLPNHSKWGFFGKFQPY